MHKVQNHKLFRHLGVARHLKMDLIGFLRDTYIQSDDISLKIKPNFEFDPISKGMFSSVSLTFNFKNRLR